MHVFRFVVLATAIVALPCCSSAPSIMQAMATCQQSGANTQNVRLKGLPWMNTWRAPYDDFVKTSSTSKKFAIAADLDGKEPLRGLPILIQDDNDVLGAAPLDRHHPVEFLEEFHCVVKPGTHMQGVETEAVGYLVPTSYKADH